MQVLDERWSHAGDMVPMEKETIDVWRARYPSGRHALKAFQEVLSKNESDISERFIHLSHRKHYVYAHGMLRMVLSAYVDCPPHSIEFASDSFGKPFIEKPESGNAIRFNLSHSHEIVLLAVSCSSDMGIDVEYVRDVPDARQIASRNFSSSEWKYLDALPADQFERAFFKCWTLKESFIKAIGKGLSYPLDGFSVQLSDEPAPQIRIQTTRPEEEGDHWVAYPLYPAPRYSAALTADKHVKHIRLVEFDSYHQGMSLHR